MKGTVIAPVPFIAKTKRRGGREGGKEGGSEEGSEEGMEELLVKNTEIRKCKVYIGEAEREKEKEKEKE